ncbi:hypothetical protein AGMMS4952_06290 [Spirochaetia bacterium]|nr:hypothetical protein AGMMS4952_06290 [Spirochaetia bacterium]
MKSWIQFTNYSIRHKAPQNKGFYRGKVPGTLIWGYTMTEVESIRNKALELGYENCGIIPTLPEKLQPLYQGLSHQVSGGTLRHEPPHLRVLPHHLWRHLLGWVGYAQRASQ